MSVIEATKQVNFEKGLWLIAHDRIVQVPIANGDGSPKNLTGLSLEYVVRTTPAALGVPLLNKTIANGKLSLSSDPGYTNNVVNILIARADTYDSLASTVTIVEGKYWHTLRFADSGSYIPLFEGYVWITATAAR